MRQLSYSSCSPDRFELSTGRVIDANNHIVGIDAELDVFGGYDDFVVIGAEQGLTPPECVELADFMLARWAAFRAKWLALVPLLILFATSASAQVQYIGYFSHDPYTPLASTIVAQPSMNLLFVEQIDDPSIWRLLEVTGRKAIIPWPWFHYDAPDAAWVQTWTAQLIDHRDQIAAIYLADEPDCVYGCEETAWRLEMHAMRANALLPGVATWVNYSGLFVADMFALGSTHRFPRNVSWISMDAYGPWDAPMQRWGIWWSTPQLLDLLQQRLTYGQRVMLVPAAFTSLDWGLTTDDVLAIAAAHDQYARTHPTVIGLALWMWTWPGTWGARESPLIRETYDQIARGLGLSPRPLPEGPLMPTGTPDRRIH